MRKETNKKSNATNKAETKAKQTSGNKACKSQGK